MTCKTGKHGHAKARYAGLDIFTGKRYEDAMPTSHNVQQPIGNILYEEKNPHPYPSINMSGFPPYPVAVTKRDFVLVGISEDGFASLLDGESGAMDESLTLPPPAHLRRNTEEESEMYKTLVRACERAWFSFSDNETRPSFCFSFGFDRCASSGREHKKSMSRCCTPWAWLLFNPLQPVHVRWTMQPPLSWCFYVL